MLLPIFTILAGCALHVYQYEPAVSALRGRIVGEDYANWPGGGEIEAEAVERAWILDLERPIWIRSDVGDAGYVERREVHRVQLIWDDTDAIQAVDGRNVEVEGTLVPAETGDHHTEVLLVVRSLRP